MAQPELTNAVDPTESATGGTYSNPPAYFGEALEDAERLLKYAAEFDIDIDDNIRDHILQARTASSVGWDEGTVAHVLTALSKLAARLKPVSAESLKAYSDGTRPTVRNYLSSGEGR